MEKPDWRELVQSKLDKPQDQARTNCIRTNATLDLIINRAARARNLSVTAYIRRAAVAVACADLGIDWDSAMADEPGFGLYGERPGRAVIRPDGRGFGPWWVTGLAYHHPEDELSEPRSSDARGVDGQLVAGGEGTRARGVAEP